MPFTAVEFRFYSSEMSFLAISAILAACDLYDIRSKYFSRFYLYSTAEQYVFIHLFPPMLWIKKLIATIHTP
jgi:hypothetical protein